MKIVFLNPIGKIGGAEKALLTLLGGLRRAEPDWSLHLIAAGEGPLAERARRLGVHSEILPLPPRLARLGDSGLGKDPALPLRLPLLSLKMLAAGPPALAYLRRLRGAFRDAGPDLIHSNGLKTHVLAAWAKPERSTLLWHIHDYVGSRPVISRLLRRLASPKTIIVTNSLSVARDVEATCGPRLNLRPIHYAVDLEVFCPVGPLMDLDRSAGLPPAPIGAIRVGLVATFARWKGHETFLKALSMLPRDLPIRGYIVGGALYETSGSQYTLKDLRMLADRMGLSERVGFTGFVEAPQDALRALDIVVHASTAPEPFGLVIAEAMACGRAVIVSLAGGAAEIVSVEEDALPLQPGDAAGLAEGIVRLAKDAGLRARLGQAARASAERRFSPARFIGEMISAYGPAIKPIPARSAG